MEILSAIVQLLGGLALFPVPQISPQHRRQDHEDHDPVQRLYIGSI